MPGIVRICRDQLFQWLLFLLSFMGFAATVNAQEDSCGLRISLLTCSPGEELYSIFGHSALRVQDSTQHVDLIYNYGTFDFDDPDFYSKFVRGKLLYMVTVSRPADFLQEYEYFNRGVSEQVLDLSCDEKIALADALAVNAKPENRYYHYDFTYDNCTTRLRDQIEKALTDSLQTAAILPNTTTSFRNLIHDYLNRGDQPWSKLGIDILLGKRLDKKMSNHEAQFLPDYLEMALNRSQLREHPLVSEKRLLLPVSPMAKSNRLFTPAVCFGLLFLLIFAGSFLRPEPLRKFFAVFDVVFFLCCGLIGLLLLFMWWGTDHFMTKDNYNLAWAIPTHALIVFFMRKQKTWVRIYFKLILAISVLLVFTWFFLPQQLNLSLLPVVGISIVRSYFLSKAPSRR